MPFEGYCKLYILYENKHSLFQIRYLNLCYGTRYCCFSHKWIMSNTYFVVLNFSFFFLIECIIYSLHSFRVIIRLTASDGAFKLHLIMLMVMKQSELAVRPKVVKTEIPIIPSFVFVILALFSQNWQARKSNEREEEHVRCRWKPPRF